MSIFTAEVRKVLNVGIPSPADIGQNLRQFHLPADKELIRKLWKLLQHWHSKGHDWKPHFSKQPIVPLSDGRQLISVEECTTLSVINPVALRVLGNGVEHILANFGCKIVDYGADGLGTPWECAFDAGVTGVSPHMANLIAESMKRCNISGNQCTQIRMTNAAGFSAFLGLVCYLPFDQLAHLPLFENLRGSMVSIRDQGVELIPESFDSDVFKELLEPKEKFVSRKEHATLSFQEKRNLNHTIPQTSVLLPETSRLVGFFRENILPVLKRSRPNCTAILDAAFAILDGCLDTSLTELIHEPMVIDIDTSEFHVANKFVSGSVANILKEKKSVFLTLDRNAFGPKSIKLLKRIGLHTDFDDATLPECLKHMDQIMISHGAEQVCSILRVATTKLFLNPQVHPLMDFLKGPVFPTATLTQYNLEESKRCPEQLVKLSEAADYSNRRLLCTSIPVLHESLGSLQDLRRIMGLHTGVNLEHVLRHLVNITKEGGLYCDWRTKGYALRDLQEDYDAVWKHLERKCSSNEDMDTIVAALHDKTCVQILHCDRFVKPSDLSYDVFQITTTAPFAVPDRFKSSPCINILRRLGASQFAWSFLDKIGCPQSSRSQDGHLNSLDGPSLMDLMLGAVDRVAPTLQEKELKFKSLREIDQQCWQMFREFMGRNCQYHQASRLALLPIFETS